MDILPPTYHRAMLRRDLPSDPDQGAVAERLNDRDLAAAMGWYGSREPRRWAIVTKPTRWERLRMWLREWVV